MFIGRPLTLIEGIIIKVNGDNFGCGIMTRQCYVYTFQEHGEASVFTPHCQELPPLV